MKKLLLLTLSIYGTYAYSQQIERFNGTDYIAGANIVGSGDWTRVSGGTSTSFVKIDNKNLKMVDGVQAKSIRINGISGAAHTVALKIQETSGFPTSAAHNNEVRTNNDKELYAAFPIYVESAAVQDFFFSVRSVGTQRGRVYIKPVTGGFQLALSTGNNSPESFDQTLNKSVYNYGHTYYLIYKWRDNGSDENNPRGASLYVIDGESNVPVTEQAAISSTDVDKITVSNHGISGVAFPHILFNQTTNFDMYVGGIILRDTWPLAPVVTPVTLSSFTATRQNQHVKLKWQTASEKDNSHFELLRKTNKDDFEVLTVVTGNATTSNVSNYEYLDSNPLNGNNYYQLNQVDFDGKSEKSEVVHIKTDFQDEYFKICSEKEAVNFDVFSEHAEKGKIRIFDLNGTTRGVYNVDIVAGVNSFSFPFNLSNGIYVGMLTTYSKVKTHKFLK